MRTEHETDMIDKNNLHIISEFFNYDLALWQPIKTDAEIVEELKAKNQKKVKKLYTTARLIEKTLEWSEVPRVYSAICIEIIKACNSFGIII